MIGPFESPAKAFTVGDAQGCAVLCCPSCAWRSGSVAGESIGELGDSASRHLAEHLLSWLARDMAGDDTWVELRGAGGAGRQIQLFAAPARRSPNE